MSHQCFIPQTTRDQGTSRCELFLPRSDTKHFKIQARNADVSVKFDKSHEKVFSAWIWRSKFSRGYVSSEQWKNWCCGHDASLRNIEILNTFIHSFLSLVDSSVTHHLKRVMYNRDPELSHCFFSARHDWLARGWNCCFCNFIFSITVFGKEKLIAGLAHFET